MSDDATVAMTSTDAVSSTTVPSGEGQQPPGISTIGELVVRARTLVDNVRISTIRGDVEGIRGATAELVQLRNKHSRAFQYLESMYARAGKASQISDFSPTVDAYIDVPDYGRRAAVARGGSREQVPAGPAGGLRDLMMALSAEQRAIADNITLTAQGYDVDAYRKMRRGELSMPSDTSRVEDFELAWKLSSDTDKIGLIARDLIIRGGMIAKTAAKRYGVTGVGQIFSLDEISKGYDSDVMKRKLELAENLAYKLGNEPLLTRVQGFRETRETRAGWAKLYDEQTGQTYTPTVAQVDQIMRGESGSADQKLQLEQAMRAQYRDEPSREVRGRLSDEARKRWGVSLEIQIPATPAVAEAQAKSTADRSGNLWNPVAALISGATGGIVDLSVRSEADRAFADLRADVEDRPTASSGEAATEWGNEALALLTKLDKAPPGKRPVVEEVLRRTIQAYNEYAAKAPDSKLSQRMRMTFDLETGKLRASPSPGAPKPDSLVGKESTIPVDGGSVPIVYTDAGGTTFKVTAGANKGKTGRKTPNGGAVIDEYVKEK